MDTQVKISGIKCDNPSCDYRDDTVKFEEYKDWIDKPCPECGTNLLTKKEVKMCELLMGAAKLADKLFGGKGKNTQEEMASVEINFVDTDRKFGNK